MLPLPAREYSMTVFCSETFDFIDDICEWTFEEASNSRVG